MFYIAVAIVACGLFWVLYASTKSEWRKKAAEAEKLEQRLEDVMMLHHGHYSWERDQLESVRKELTDECLRRQAAEEKLATVTMAVNRTVDIAELAKAVTKLVGALEDHGTPTSPEEPDLDRRSEGVQLCCKDQSLKP